MSFTKTLALSAALGLSFAGAAQAEDFSREFDQVGAARASEGEAVQLRFSMPLGGHARADRQDGPRLALRMSQATGGGDLRALDVVSYNFGAAEPVQTPFAMGYAEGGFWSKPQNWLLVGLGAAVVVWGVVELTEDDDDDQQTQQQ